MAEATPVSVTKQSTSESTKFLMTSCWPSYGCMKEDFKSRLHFSHTAQHHTQSLASPIIVVHRSRPSASGERSDPTLKSSRLSLRTRAANNPRLLFRKSPASIPISPRKVGPGRAACCQSVSRGVRIPIFFVFCIDATPLCLLLPRSGSYHQSHSLSRGLTEPITQAR